MRTTDMEHDVQLLELERRRIMLTYSKERLQICGNFCTIEMRYNENHNPDNGQFTSGSGASAGASSGSAARRGSKGRKSLKVSKKEYAVIADSISRNYNSRFEKHAGKGSCYVQSANYNYEVSIHGRHSFTILKRRRIK